MLTKTRQLDHKQWKAAIEHEDRAFRDQRTNLLDRYEGEFVAMYNGQVAGHNADDSTLFREMMDALGYVPFFIARVSHEPEVDEFDSPEIAD